MEIKLNLLLAFVLLFSSNLHVVLGRYEPSMLEISKSDGANAELQTYIVYVEHPKGVVFASAQERQSWHKSFLPASAASESESRTIYSYGSAISGFAARLTADEVKAMQKVDGFLHALADRLVPVHTTRTPSFLGLPLLHGIWNASNYGKGVIIGLVDTGITPGHPSFSGNGVPPPPPKWKGRCDLNATDCNNKLIGARAFLAGANAMKGGPAASTPVDIAGHGTHTAGTAAGVFVERANVLGSAYGTAAGMAPLAHLAVYRVCDKEECALSDILAGLDTAVEDGVDVISLSIGGESLPFFNDSMAIGAYGAIEKGVFVSCAGGNSGPGDSTLSNEAPWILTVAASTLDRTICSTVMLADGQKLDGQAILQNTTSEPTFFPLVFAGRNDNPNAIFCGNGSLDGVDVKGKIVLCVGGGNVKRIDKGSTVKSAGGAGMILMNPPAIGFTTAADAHVLPASHVSFADGFKIMTYINSTSAPRAAISFKGTILGTSPAPAMAGFSSRGPSLASPGILKPDITGPGVNVLAAWNVPVGPSPVAPSAAAIFNIISGTSMSTPHLSGIAALIKSAHPDWSPAAIKSALMTTADLLDRSGNPIVDQAMKPANFFATGAGHVNPSKAVDPGLVYDLAASDYVPYLCGLGYTSAEVGLVTRRATNCSTAGSIAEGELNYPSMTVTLPATNGSVAVKRTVTNVGDATEKYAVTVRMPEGVSVSVDPETLQFGVVNEEKSFTVTFVAAAGGFGGGDVAEGRLHWVSDKHVVTSPIVVRFMKN